MKRTTIRLNEQLLDQAKRAGLDSGRTLTQVIEDSLRESLSRRRPSTSGRKVVLPTFGGDGVQPGVDLSDSAGLLDLMEEYDASSRR
jgi:hypothetical protein